MNTIKMFWECFVRIPLQEKIEKMTGKHCANCKHKDGPLCGHPDPKVNKRCRTGLFPVGYEKGDQE